MTCVQCGLEQADGSTHCAQCGSLMAPPIRIGGLDAPLPVRKAAVRQPSRPEAAPGHETASSVAQDNNRIVKLAAGVLLGSLAIGWLLSSGLQTVGRWMEPAPKPKPEATLQAPPLEELAPVDAVPVEPPPVYLPAPAPDLVGPPAPDNSSFTEEELRQRRLESLQQIPPDLRPHLGELPKDREIHYLLNFPDEGAPPAAPVGSHVPGEPMPETRDMRKSRNCNSACSGLAGGPLARQNCLNQCLLGEKMPGTGRVDPSVSATGCETVCGALKHGDLLIYTTCIAECLSGGKGGGPD